MRYNIAIITGLFYAHGKDWDRFVHRSIQHWEQFYIQWIANTKKVLVVYLDDLGSNLTNTFKNVITFLNLKSKTDFLNKSILYAKTSNFGATNTCISDEPYSFNMYTKPHVVWINSAIKTVKNHLKKRGLNASRLSDYENTNLKINICP